MTRRGSVLGVESLEGRALLSGMTAISPGVRAAAFGLPSGIKTDPAAVAAVLTALRGGAGSEFVTLLRRQVPNLNAVITGFITGARRDFTTPGIAIRLPGFQESFTGRHYDHLALTMAGAVVMPGNTLELASVSRGLFDEAVPSYVVFGIDRGSGARLGPPFVTRPGITPDALVTVAVGPYGSHPTVSMTDLRTGVTTPLPNARVHVTGAVVRAFVDLGSLPSAGAPVAKYRFAVWTRPTLDGGVGNVASFLPNLTMVPVGALSPPKTPRR